MSSYSLYTRYELEQLRKLKNWQQRMRRSPGIFSRMSNRLQKKINNVFPQKLHKAITLIIKKMIQAVLFTSELIKPTIQKIESLEMTEKSIIKRLEYYRGSAAIEGGITGMGGILAALADFPALMAIKLKFLFDVAALYGHNTADIRERVYLLHVFQLAFSNPVHRKEVFEKLRQWSTNMESIPSDIHSIDWQDFQIQYRDYLDLAKLAQMLPGIGAAVGLIVNYRLLNHLGKTAMMCYRMRWFAAANKS